MGRTKKIEQQVTNETNVTSEIRKFKMHPDLLFSVIQAQAGTAEKAILEAVMNAVDAGATKCDLKIDEKGYTIVDDGKGFNSRKEVDEFFETFGTPHKEGDATYGRFRMGRGQLFAFSSTVWRTTTFEMSVDIKKTGLDYVFKENLKDSKGCTINGTWYEKFGTQDLFNMFRELEKLIKYMQIPVYLNEKLVTLEVESQKWDYKEEDFFIKVNKNANTLSVYNMGALVAHYPASRFGVGGTVVTRKALQVNFARNDVLVAKCSLWKKIDKKLKEVMGIEVDKKTVLSDVERAALLNDVIGGHLLMGEVYSKGIMEDVSGKKISFKNLVGMEKFSISSGNWNSRKLEQRVNDTKICPVLPESILTSFGVKNADELIAAVQLLIEKNNKTLKDSGNWNYGSRHTWIYQTFNPKVLNIEDLLSKMNDVSSTLEPKELNKTQKAFKEALDAISGRVAYVVYKEQRGNYEQSSYDLMQEKTRRIVLGVSDTSQGWTDGSTYIAVDTKMMHACGIAIIHLMIHEYCHTEQTMETHDHGMDFYKLFHDVIHNNSYEVQNILIDFQRSYNRAMLKQGIKPKKMFDEQIEIMTTNQELIGSEDATEIKIK